MRRRSGDDVLPETNLLPSGIAPAEPLLAVAVHGERIAVGAPRCRAGIAMEGAVFLLERELGTWQQAQRLLSGTPNMFGAFGSELACASDGALLGSARPAHRTGSITKAPCRCSRRVRAIYFAMDSSEAVRLAGI